ncbi:MAG TPA: glycosyltransferase family 9 protein [Usitatibacter sp.]|nr:glycosyltransferase family 9 protein [Usitatibacter sp.]
MGERSATRALVVSRALVRRLARPRGAAPEIRRVLVAHNLLLGDTVMLTPLLAKIRARYPQAEATLLAAPAFVPLYAGRPYGVRALPFRPAESATTRALLDEPPFDLAIVAGDNRYSWLAAAMRARRIVAHSGDRPGRKSWLVDESRPYASEPSAWGDMVADLVDGDDPPPYARGDWPDPPARAFERPAVLYAVLHVGASTPLKQWLPERWNALAKALRAQGLAVVWSAGRGEEALVRACDPASEFPSLAGALDLPQLWQLLRGAALLVAPDTGVAHLGRAAWTPTVTLFGPGSPVVAGRGRFWRDTPWAGVAEDPFPCRDQRILFRREVEWVRRCGRSTAECAEPRCMHAIPVERVLAAAEQVRAAGHR